MLFSAGCSEGTEEVLVDFNHTKPVEEAYTSPRSSPALKVAVGAMVSPRETLIYYGQLLDYIGRKVDLEVELIQRKTYGEINDLLAQGQIDLAFVCSGPYVAGRDKFGFELIATPQVQGSSFYHSYLIVNRDTSFERIENLRGKVFAFTDPDSNTGRLVPAYWLAQMGENPENFFKKTIYTHSHDNSILAVAKGLVDGAAVDGLVWEYYRERNPSLTALTRVIRKSDPYGNPPVVASRYLSSDLKKRIGQVLFSLHLDPDCEKILRSLMINRFLEPQEEWYDGIRRIHSALASQERKPHGSHEP
jgi:phosphonate transport system substrate-binding protein